MRIWLYIWSTIPPKKEKKNWVNSFMKRNDWVALEKDVKWIICEENFELWKKIWLICGDNNKLGRVEK